MVVVVVVMVVSRLSDFPIVLHLSSPLWSHSVSGILSLNLLFSIRISSSYIIVVITCNITVFLLFSF